MPIAEFEKTQQEIPDSPKIDRLVRHVNHMKKRLDICSPSIKEHIKEMLKAAEDTLLEAIKDFREICEHDFENVLGDNPHYDGPVRIGRKCRKCFIFLK